jgi:hypothetical protein
MALAHEQIKVETLIDLNHDNENWIESRIEQVFGKDSKEYADTLELEQYDLYPFKTHKEARCVIILPLRDKKVVLVTPFDDEDSEGVEVFTEPKGKSNDVIVRDELKEIGYSQRLIQVDLYNILHLGISTDNIIHRIQTEWLS